MINEKFCVSQRHLSIVLINNRQLINEEKQNKSKTKLNSQLKNIFPLLYRDPGNEIVGHFSFSIRSISNLKLPYLFTIYSNLSLSLSPANINLS